MERRRDVRVSLDQTVRVTALGRNRYQVQGRAGDLSGRGIRILVPVRMTAGAAVRIDLKDGLLLGEVCYCQSHDDGFMIGVHLDQALSGLAELSRLNRALLSEGDERERDRAALSYSVSE